MGFVRKTLQDDFVFRIMFPPPHDVLCGIEGNPEMPERQFSYLRNKRVGGNNLSYARQLICDGNMNTGIIFESFFCFLSLL